MPFVHFRMCTCTILVVIFVELKKNGRWNHQEVPERGRGGMSNDWKPLTQTPKPLKQSKTSSDKTVLAGNVPFLTSSRIPAGNRWAGACEQWWLYWMFWTATSLIVSCINSLLLKRDAQVSGIRTCCKQHQCDSWLPCSSLTVHTIRSTQAAFAWQRSLRGLCSTDNPVESWSTRCSSDWLLLNCSSTKSCTSRTNDGCRAKKQQVSEWMAKTVCGFKDEYARAIITFHVVQSVP